MILFEFYSFKWKKRKKTVLIIIQKKTQEKEYKMTMLKEYKKVRNDIK